MQLSDQEYKSALGKTADLRYDYFLKCAVAQGYVVSLIDPEGEDYAAIGDEDGNMFFPVWPHERFASLFAFEDWASYKTETIILDQFMLEILESLELEGIGVAVFPVRNGGSDNGMQVGVRKLKRDLQTLLSLTKGDPSGDDDSEDVTGLMMENLMAQEMLDEFSRDESEGDGFEADASADSDEEARHRLN